MNTYCRPQNLRDIVRAYTPKTSKTNLDTEPTRPQATNLLFLINIKELKPQTQVHIIDFVCPTQEMGNNNITNSCTMGDISTPTNTPHKTTSVTVIKAIPKLTMKTCISKQCRYCPNLDCNGEITCYITGTTYTCKNSFKCKGSNLVYGISCLTYNQQYKGKNKHLIHVSNGQTKHKQSPYIRQPDKQHHLNNMKSCQPSWSQTHGKEPLHCVLVHKLCPGT